MNQKAILNNIKQRWRVEYLLMYFVEICILYIMHKKFPSGVCGPNADIFAFLLVILINLIIWLVNVYHTIWVSRQNWKTLAIHSFGNLLLLTFAFIGEQAMP